LIGEFMEFLSEIPNFLSITKWSIQRLYVLDQVSEKVCIHESQLLQLDILEWMLLEQDKSYPLFLVEQPLLFDVFID
jgi:hypothetical protein